MGNPANRYKPPVATGDARDQDTSEHSEYASPLATQAPELVSLFKKRVVTASALSINSLIRLEELKDPQLSGALCVYLRSLMLFPEAFDLSTTDINTLNKALNLCFIRWNKANNLDARVFDTRHIPPIELFSRYYWVSTATPKEINTLFAISWEGLGLSDLYARYWTEQRSKNKSIAAAAISNMTAPKPRFSPTPSSAEVPTGDDITLSSTPIIVASIVPDTPSPIEAVKLPRVHRNSTITGNRLHFMKPLLAIKPTTEITEEAFKAETILALLDAMQSLIPPEKQPLCEEVLSPGSWTTSWRRQGEGFFLWVELNWKGLEQILPTLRVFGVSQAALVWALQHAKVPLTGEILVQIPTI